LLERVLTFLSVTQVIELKLPVPRVYMRILLNQSVTKYIQDIVYDFETFALPIQEKESAYNHLSPISQLVFSDDYFLLY